MYIGKLNDRLSALTLDAAFLGSDTVPEAKENGNPLLGETFLVHWQQLLDRSLALTVAWRGSVSVNDVVLRLGEKCTPRAVRIRDKRNGALLCSHLAETGECIRKRELVLPVEAELEGFVIEFDNDFSSVILDGIDIYGADFAGERLFPEPANITRGEGYLSCTAVTGYVAEDEIAKNAARILCEKWRENIGAALAETQNGEIRLLLNKELAANGYRLEVSEKQVRIEAADLRGMVYGTEVLLKLVSEGKIPVCRIEDAPYMPFRGVHLMLPPKSEFTFTKRLVKYVLSPMGYNAVILYFGGALQYESHPEINEAVERAVAKGRAGEWPRFPHDKLGDGRTVPKSAVKDLVDYCRSFGIEVIPEVQALGHVQFMTEAYPEIAERATDATDEQIDTREADLPPSDFYAHSYCPSNPKSYELLFDILDEVLELFAPCPYVHMGHDEVYQLGVCPKCRKRTRADLFAEDIEKIHAYLQKRGAKMMIWSDMIQTVESYPHRVLDVIHRIPKDIICLDFIWYFTPELDIEDNLLREGFRVAVGNLYSSHYPRYEARMAKKGMIGGQVSAWTVTDEATLGREGKIYDFLMTAELLWSKKYTSYARFSYDKLLREMMPTLRERLGARKYPSRERGARRTVICDNGAFDPEHFTAGGSFAADAFAKSLIIEHTATKKIMRYPWVENDVLGDYAVYLADGTVEKIPVTYAGLLTHFERRQGEPFRHKYYRHNGYTATYFTEVEESRLADGRFCSIFAYEWINPTPEKKIVRIEYVSNGKFDADVYVRRITAIN